MTKTGKRKRVKTKEEKQVEEGAGVTRPGGGEKPVGEEPKEGVEKPKEPIAEIPPEEAALEERSPRKHTIFEQCMKDLSFRRRVIYHLVKKLG